MKLIKVTFFVFLLLLINKNTVIGQSVEEFKQAKFYFQELDSLSAIDDAKMWGKKLNGATMFVFPKQRIVLANEADPAGKLLFKEGLYFGRLPENINIANTSFEWNGKDWTMVNWNAVSKTDAYSRGKLLLHESWHRIQKEIGIEPVMTKNTHLDELEGSVLLKMEFMALIRALNQPSENMDQHLINALTIRLYRQFLFPENNEDAFEMHEGMAEYTGFKLCGLNDEILPKILAKQLEIALDKDGLANSFAYLTGPAYAVLFSKLKENWLNDALTVNSLTKTGIQLVKKQFPTNKKMLKKQLEDIKQAYQAMEMIKKETEKFELQKQLVKAYEEKFLKGEVLLIKNNQLQFSFNPQEKLIPVQNGVVYNTMRLSGEWGVAEIKNGVFRSNDWQYFILPAPLKKEGTIVELDYSLNLKEGWEVVEVKKGKYSLKQKE